jgi:hypothetical protein
MLDLQAIVLRSNQTDAADNSGIPLFVAGSDAGLSCHLRRSIRLTPFLLRRK